MSKFKHWLIIGLLCVALQPLHAEFFTIKDYHVSIDIHSRDAYFDIVETITVVFSEPRHGIIRKIPYKYKQDGKVKEYKIFGVDVDGFHYKDSKGSQYYTIKIGSAETWVEGQQVYKIKYKVKKAWLFLADHTEFYWNIIGDQWETSIDSVRYSIKLDQPLPMTINDYVVYTGQTGQQSRGATIDYYVGTFTGGSNRSLEPGEGITIAINLPIDYIVRPTAWQIWWEKYGLMASGGSLFTVIFGMFYLVWHKYGKDYPIVSMVQYSPPTGITPAEAGVIIDEKADNIDVISLIPYWAHQGLLNIKRISSTFGKDDHQLIKLKSLPDNALPFEKIMFNKLFAGGDTIVLSSLENYFADTLTATKSSLQSHLTNLGIYYPISMRAQIMTYIGSGLLIICAFLVFVMSGSIWLLLGLLFSGLVGFFFAFHMLKHNEKGVHLYQHIVGFKMFVKAAEKDKIERMLKEDPDYFEKTLPYALIFGYAKQWSAKFDGLLLEPPKWYIGPHGYYGGGYFNTGDFGRTFEDSVHEIESVFTSVPETSGNFGSGSGGGFSGGGFSGGGFGGGGGSSW
jgi:uncharacterized membrane protein YgcG